GYRRGRAHPGVERRSRTEGSLRVPAVPRCITIAPAGMGKNARVNAYQVPADPTAVIGRRIVAFIFNSVIRGGAFFLGGVVADFKSEEIPEALRDQDICDQLTESDTVSTCFKINDTIYYSESDAAAFTFWLPSLGVVLLNHIVLAGATGASVGKHIVGLR